MYFRIAAFPTLVLLAAFPFSCSPGFYSTQKLAAEVKPSNLPKENFSLWCQQKGGVLSPQSLCQVQEVVHFGWNENFGRIETGLLVYLNDSVSISMNGQAGIFVGEKDYGQEKTFVSQSQGPLVFQGDELKRFRVKSVKITRCFNPSGYGVTCS